MCKTSFNTIIHNVQLDNTYSKVGVTMGGAGVTVYTHTHTHTHTLQFEVKARATSSTQEVSINEARRFRYSTTGSRGGRPGERERRGRRPRQTRRPAIEERRRCVCVCGEDVVSIHGCAHRAVYATGLRAVAPTTSNKQTRTRNICRFIQVSNSLSPSLPPPSLPPLSVQLPVSIAITQLPLTGSYLG